MVTRNGGCCMIAGLKRQQINKIRQALRLWYGRPVGKWLLQQERERLSEVLPTLFGYHIVQMGSLLGDELLTSSRIPHRVLIDPDRGCGVSPLGLYAYPDAIPIAADSVDVVVLHHTLEFERDPHQILREVDRILIPEGHVVILGFNPWSLWGLWRLARGRKGDTPWCGDFLSPSRVKDWMALLGFDVAEVKHHFFRPPLKNRLLMRRLRFMERLGQRFWPGLSGAYLLVAQKRVTTVTPIKPRWQPRRRLLGELARPTTRSTQCRK